MSQPHVCPIVRGKASGSVEFDAKISVSKVHRFAFLDRLSWDSYNENANLKPVVEQYRERYGSYPEMFMSMRLSNTGEPSLLR